MSSQNWECACGVSNIAATKFCGGCGKRHMILDSFTGYIQVKDNKPNIEVFEGPSPRKRIPFVKPDGRVKWATLWPDKEALLGDALTRVGQHYAVETATEPDNPSRCSIKAMRLIDTVEADPGSAPAPAQSNGSSPGVTDDARQLLIMRQSTLGYASVQTATLFVKVFEGVLTRSFLEAKHAVEEGKDPHEIGALKHALEEASEHLFLATCELAQKYLGYVITGDYEGLVQEVIDTGAVIKAVEPATEEDKAAVEMMQEVE